MADVNIQQPAPQPTVVTTSGGGSGAVWAILVIVLLAIIAWFVFGGGLHRTTNAKVKINTPGASAPAPSGGGSPPSGTKTP